MKQYRSPRASLYRGQGFGLRRFVVPAMAVGIIYTGYSLLASGGTVESVDVLASDTAASVPEIRIIPATSAASTYSLRDAFSTQPAAVSNETDAEMANIAKEMAALEPGAGIDARPAIKKVAVTASLHAGLKDLLRVGDNLLQSGRKLTVAKGDTLMDLLVKNSVSRSDAHEAITALKKIYDPRNLNPGHEVTVFFHEDPTTADPQFRGLSIEKDVINTVRVNRSADGSYIVKNDEKPVHHRTRSYSGTINNSLYVDAENAGLPDAIILDMIRMYSWGVDFQRDIQNGDSFEVMYDEMITEDGKIVPGKGDITYAKLSLSGRDMPYYLFTDSDGERDYYDETGQSAKKALMKTPIDGARLSSGFGMRRHPVLGYSKMHKGVDFAAARGTPIYAAGDGVIKRMGPFSSYGNYVRIRHNNGIETAYAHMNGFKSGLKSGMRVKQGQVIGYVGTTGRSTGPHLHYEVLLGGKQVNPAGLKLPTGKILKGKELETFKTTVADANRQFKDTANQIEVAAAQ